MHVAVDHHGPVGQTVAAQCGQRDRHVVEKAVAAREVVAGVVGPSAEVHRDVAFDGVTGRRDRPADRAAPSLHQLVRPRQPQAAFLAHRQGALADAREQAAVVDAGQLHPVHRIGLEHLLAGCEPVRDDALGEQLVLLEGKPVVRGQRKAPPVVSPDLHQGAQSIAMALPPPTIASTVVVTGASAGIGSELARELARRSYNVVLVARRTERLRALAEELRLAHGFQADVETCDLTDTSARHALVGRLGAGEREVVGVCNNAGFGTVGKFLSAGVEREQQVVRLNIEAVHHLTGAFLERMVEQGTGAILNVASTAAFQPLPGFATYAASKAFVQSFSEAVHAELGGTGVSVSCLCPGFTRTEFGDTAGAAEEERAMPDFLFTDAVDVARAGVEAMVTGRRTVIPGLMNRASMIGGRAAPRSLLLPLVRHFTGRG